MTTIMPMTTIADVMRPIKGLESALKTAAGKDNIPASADRKIDAFDSSVKSYESFSMAVQTAIRIQDGRTWPWAVGVEVEPPNTFIPRPTPGMPRPIPEPPFMPPKDDAKFQVDTSVLYPMAEKLDELRTSLHEQLKEAALGRIDQWEADRMTKLITALETASKILTKAIEERGKLAKDNRSPDEIFNELKNAVNSRDNDVRGGPFGLLTKFGEAEAEKFIVALKRTGISQEKAQEVLTMVYDTASSPFGDLVLDAKAAKKLEERAVELGLVGLDWSAAVDAYKNDHPIVALYSVAINDALEDRALGSNVRALEAMLRAGEAAYTELSVDFVRRGPVALGGAEMPEASALAAAMGAPERAGQVQNLGSALEKLRARVAELKAQGG